MILTANSKTVVSVDFDRIKTCPQICSYCYVGNMERIYPAYATKIQSNYSLALNSPDDFAKQLNKEYWKLRTSKAKTWKSLKKLPVRIYGSGDFIPIHFKFLSKLTFKFYIISKALTNKSMKPLLDDLLLLPNLTSIVLSFDGDNKDNFSNVSSYKNKDKIRFAYTGLPQEYKQIDFKNYDIFFNISDKKINKIAAREFKSQCPCDSGVLAHKEACTVCNKCWRSSITKSNNWNTAGS